MKDIHSFVILAYNESDDLEECIKSIKKQSIKSNVLIATSTNNDYIRELASKYSIGVIVNENKSNKGSDYNFALSCVNTRLITIVHQDDLYNRNYCKKIIECYKKNKDASLIFTNYYEIHDDKKIIRNKRLFKKRIFLKPLQYSFFNKKAYFRKLAIKYGNNICSSSVTYVKDNIPNNLFSTDYIYNNDWSAYLNLCNNKRFVYINECLVGYRYSNKKENEEKIKEDIKIYNRVLPKKIVDVIYKNR